MPATAFWNEAPPVPFFAGIPNLMAQGGHSQSNFGFVELATLTPIEHYPATYACKWFKEYMAISNTAGCFAVYSLEASCQTNLAAQDKFC